MNHVNNFESLMPSTSSIAGLNSILVFSPSNDSPGNTEEHLHTARVSSKLKK